MNGGGYTDGGNGHTDTRNKVKLQILLIYNFSHFNTMRQT